MLLRLRAFFYVLVITSAIHIITYLFKKMCCILNKKSLKKEYYYLLCNKKHIIQKMKFIEIIKRKVHLMHIKYFVKKFYFNNFFI